MLKEYKPPNTSQFDYRGHLESMGKEYLSMSAGDAPKHQGLKTYYKNIKSFTYKLGCPEVGEEVLSGPSSCQYKKARFPNRRNSLVFKYSSLTLSETLKLTHYSLNLQTHDDPLRNIAEMRKFHATQMPFFHRLQDQLQDQIKKNNEQQEIITALVFRHLLEHLPPAQTRYATSKIKRRPYVTLMRTS